MSTHEYYVKLVLTKQSNRNSPSADESCPMRRACAAAGVGRVHAPLSRRGRSPATKRQTAIDKSAGVHPPLFARILLPRGMLPIVAHNKYCVN